MRLCTYRDGGGTRLGAVEGDLISGAAAPVREGRTWVNGEPRQDGAARDMVFPVAELIAFCASSRHAIR